MSDTGEKSSRYSVNENGVIRLNETKPQGEPAPQPEQQPYRQPYQQQYQQPYPQQYQQPYPQYQQPYQQPYYPQPYAYQRNEGSNACGMTGFILSLLAVVFCWQLVLAGILWLIGLIFSIVGLGSRPRGFAVAGLMISLSLLLIGVIIFIFAFSVMAAFLSI